MIDPVLLVGAGPMAIAYAKVIGAMDVPLQVAGRGDRSGRVFHEATGVRPTVGGVEHSSIDARRAIVAVGVEQLAPVTLVLIKAGVLEILVEKPGGLTTDELQAVADTADRHGARVLIAYNRRFYASVDRARRMLAEDGGVQSFIFEFTEWRERVEAATSPAPVKQRWFLANSSHVVDLSFFLGGWPVELACTVGGGLDWHPAGSVFAGSGRTDSGALFSYTANWEAPGRWGVELMSRRRRLVLRPLEELRCQGVGSADLEHVPLDDHLDRQFKPGLYRQMATFLTGEQCELPTVHDQLRAVRGVYDPMVGVAG